MGEKMKTVMNTDNNKVFRLFMFPLLLSWKCCKLQVGTVSYKQRNLGCQQDTPVPSGVRKAHFEAHLTSFGLYVVGYGKELLRWKIFLVK
jgi:hypothetical protein